VGRSQGSQPPARWVLGLTPLVAATSATLTITLPAAHRAPLGVVLLAISPACWLTVLLAAAAYTPPHPEPTARTRPPPVRPATPAPGAAAG
jgi:hypothetical protein